VTVEHLVVRIGEDPAAAQWAVFDDDGRVVRQLQDGSLEEAAALAPGRRVVVLVPAFEVITTEATLPKASPAKLRKMLPFSLEDQLADDVDELVFAVGPRLESGAISVAVVARTRLEGWLERLAGAGLSPNAVFTEADGVPDTPSTLTLVVEDDRIYGRAPGRPPFVFDGLSLEQVLGLVDGAGETRHLLVYIDEPGRARFGAELAALDERVESTQVKLIGDGALYRFAATLIARPGTNLLQGPYAPKSNVGALLAPWRSAAVLLLGLLLVSFVGQAAEFWFLRRQSQALDAQLAESCAQLLSQQQLEACRRSVRARLSQSGLLDSSGAFLPALSAVAEARIPDSRLSQLSYRNGVMDIQLVVPDVPSLDAFTREIEGNERFDARILFANPDGDRVDGRVQIVDTGASQ